MKYLLILVVLCAASAFGQNSYGTDYLTFHCTAPDPSAPPNFGDLPKPGLVPSGAPSGNAILYCDTIAGGLKLSVSGGAYAGFGGSGTVSANNGSAGALANYAAAGGSTTVGPDSNLTDASNTLTYSGTSGISTPFFVSSGASTGACNAFSNGVKINASSNSGLTGFGANTLDICANNVRAIQFASTVVNVEGTVNLAFSGGKGQHFNTQATTNDMAGVCSGTTTTCSITFTTAYTSTPSCVLTPTTAGVTSFIITSQANTGFTVTYAPSATTNFNYICIGNPN